MIETTQQIKVGNYEIDVIRKDIKNLHLSVHPPTGRIRIASPLRVSDEAVRLFAISKIGWIRKNQKKLAAQPRQAQRQYIYRETHYFQGQAYLLNLVPTKGAAKVALKNHNQLYLHIKENATREQKEQAMDAWYRAELKQLIPDLIAKWETRMNVQVEEWGVKKMQTHWGTCNIEDRRIWLNLELAKKSTACLEYIIVHEMTHLLERHHNANFLHYMNRFLPNWKALREELNGGVLGFVEWSNPKNHNF